MDEHDLTKPHRVRRPRPERGAWRTPRKCVDVSAASSCLVQDQEATPAVSVGFCEAGWVELVVGCTGAGLGAFYGQIRPRHLLVL